MKSGYEISFQNGVKFKSENNRFITGVEIDADVHEIHFWPTETEHKIISPTISTPCIRWYKIVDSEVSFPQIETLVIEEGVYEIIILNTVFPNVKRVISRNKNFLSGNTLIKRSNEGNYLLNTFCKSESDVIDLKRVSHIKNRAFSGCKSGKIINASKTKSIEPFAFECYDGASRLPELEGGGHAMGNVLIDYTEHIPDYIKLINKQIDFSGRHVSVGNKQLLKELNLFTPSSITYSGKDIININVLFNAFNHPTLENFEISEENPYFKTVDGILYSADMKSLVRCPMGKKGRVVIPEGVEMICNEAFWCCNATEVLMPDSIKDSESGVFMESNVKRIKWSKNLTYIPDDMFYKMEHICDIVMDEGELSNAFDGSFKIPQNVNRLGRQIIDSTVERVIVHTIDGKLPNGLFRAVTKYVRERNTERISTFLVVDGVTYLIPFATANASQLDLYFKFYPFSPEPLLKQYDVFPDKAKKYLFLLLTYENSDDEWTKSEARKILCKNQRDVAKTFYYNGNFDSPLFKFISFGFASRDVLKNLAESDDFTIRAYALDALEKSNSEDDKQLEINERFYI